MKKILYAILLALTIPFSVFAQFSKMSNAEKIGSYDLGNYHLYKTTTPQGTTYHFDMRDRKYTSKRFLLVSLGNKQQAISFIHQAIETIETAKKGDSFDLGLPDGNTGFYKNDVGARSLGMYVGNIGQYGLIRKAIFSGMLRDIEAQSDDVTTADTNNDKANLQIHQEVNSHLKFAGIEIDGSLATFRSKLIEKGYKPTDSHENILQGNFAGYECDIFIYCVEGADLVHMVIASTKPEESWDRLYIKYLSLVELYSKKYGSPSNSVNKFEYPFDGTTDMQMTAVKTDHAHFMTMWNTPNGDIMISISKEGTIAIYYTDKINSAQHEVLKEQRIIDEI